MLTVEFKLGDVISIVKRSSTAKVHVEGLSAVYIVVNVILMMKWSALVVIQIK